MVHYLDHAASTPVCPAAVAAMTEVLTDEFGNPSGSHRLAREANRRLDDARATIADGFGFAPGNIVFTSGGTEADSLAVHGSLRRAERRHRGRRYRPVCSAIEHHAVLDPVLDHGGATVGVTADGVLDLGHLRTLLGQLADADTSVGLVSIMAANNETGVVQPVAEAAAITRELAPEALFHTDAVQFGAWHDTAELAGVVDLMSVSAHKLGGPKGVGFLAVADGVELPAHQIGGGQERGRRGGTQNVPGIVAMAAAIDVMIAERDAQTARIRALRDAMVERIMAALGGVVVTGRSSRSKLRTQPDRGGHAFDAARGLVVRWVAGDRLREPPRCEPWSVERRAVQSAHRSAPSPLASEVRILVSASTFCSW